MNLRTALLGLSIAAVTYLTCDATRVSRAHNRVLLDLSELDHVRQGMLNPNIWVQRITDALVTRLKSLKQQPMPINDLRLGIETLIRNQLRVTQRQYLKQHGRNTLGGIELPKQLFGRELPSIGRGKRIAINHAFNVLNKATPKLSEAITTSILEDDGLMRTTILQVVKQLHIEGIQASRSARIAPIIARYDCSAHDLQTCRKRIRATIPHQTPGLSKALTACILLFICLFICLRTRLSLGVLEYCLLTLGVASLLIGGLINPMMIIRAQLEEFGLNIVGAPITFENQVIFFQSKSILDVFEALLSSHQYESAFVGVLIGLFSIGFPALKLFGGILLHASTSNNQIAEMAKRVLQSLGKWSMADVFVVAIFMAFIGFDGIVGGQLGQLEVHDSNALRVKANPDSSQFGIGLYLFLGFCICSQLLTRLNFAPAVKRV